MGATRYSMASPGVAWSALDRQLLIEGAPYSLDVDFGLLSTMTLAFESEETLMTGSLIHRAIYK